jgi:hypothetical protein
MSKALLVERRLSTKTKDAGPPGDRTEIRDPGRGSGASTSGDGGVAKDQGHEEEEVMRNRFEKA